ncbi:DUF2303 family protein, partial [Enterobacter hormaechei]|uniref:DUF2303 family protein n=1 Tax=Enterobacter hormaechei TaxID=158836 RepID=UPI001F0A0631
KDLADEGTRCFIDADNIGADAVALPENFRIHDLEKFNLNRFRFRGALSTASIDDFTRYSKDLADEGTRCFIDADNIGADAVALPENFRIHDL